MDSIQERVILKQAFPGAQSWLCPCLTYHVQVDELWVFSFD